MTEWEKRLFDYGEKYRDDEDFLNGDELLDVIKEEIKQAFAEYIFYKESHPSSAMKDLFKKRGIV